MGAAETSQTKHEKNIGKTDKVIYFSCVQRGRNGNKYKAFLPPLILVTVLSEDDLHNFVCYDEIIRDVKIKDVELPKGNSIKIVEEFDIGLFLGYDNNGIRYVIANFHKESEHFCVSSKLEDHLKFLYKEFAEGEYGVLTKEEKKLKEIVFKYMNKYFPEEIF